MFDFDLFSTNGVIPVTASNFGDGASTSNFGDGASTMSFAYESNELDIAVNDAPPPRPK